MFEMKRTPSKAYTAKRYSSRDQYTPHLEMLSPWCLLVRKVQQDGLGRDLRKVQTSCGYQICPTALSETQDCTI